MTKGVGSGGGVDLRLRRITSSASQTFVCILYIVSVCLFKLFVCIFNFFLPLVVNKDVHKHFVVVLYAVYAAIFVQNRVFGYIRRLPLGGFPSEYRHPDLAWKN